MIEHAYIHIPFCIKKCNYCSFVSTVNLHNIPLYIEVLNKEIKERYKSDRLKTLYIGGGTPSLLSPAQIKTLVKNFIFDNDYEFTIEINPEKMTLDKFKAFKDLGINRISIGIQTFNDGILKNIGRIHSSKQAIKTVELAKNAGFDNISIDLIYGLPEQDIEILKHDLETAKELDIEHISTYGLKIEKGCYFYKNVPENLPDDDIQADMYNFLCDYLACFNHYEISNFAKNDCYSRHNCAYWLNKEYYGFGLNSSGYENNIRYKNTSNLKKYLLFRQKSNVLQPPSQTLEGGAKLCTDCSPVSESRNHGSASEVMTGASENNFKTGQGGGEKNFVGVIKEEEIKLTKQETMENEIFLGLRLKQGINVNEINKKYNIDFMKKYSSIIKKYDEMLIIADNKISLTRKGILLSNEIMSEFIS